MEKDHLRQMRDLILEFDSFKAQTNHLVDNHQVNTKRLAEVVLLYEKEVLYVMGLVGYKFNIDDEVSPKWERPEVPSKIDPPKRMSI